MSRRHLEHRFHVRTTICNRFEISRAQRICKRTQILQAENNIVVSGPYRGADTLKPRLAARGMRRRDELAVNAHVAAIRGTGVAKPAEDLQGGIRIDAWHRTEDE